MWKCVFPEYLAKRVDSEGFVFVSSSFPFHPPSTQEMAKFEKHVEEARATRDAETKITKVGVKLR